MSHTWQYLGQRIDGTALALMATSANGVEQGAAPAQEGEFDLGRVWGGIVGWATGLFGGNAAEEERQNERDRLNAIESENAALRKSLDAALREKEAAEAALEQARADHIWGKTDLAPATEVADASASPKGAAGQEQASRGCTGLVCTA